jgi:nucleotide-binding universal stress UspA family protein
MKARPQMPTSPNPDRSSNPRQPFAPPDVLVFIDDANVSDASIRHAQNVAHALGGTVELLQVLCEPSDVDGPIDPVDWDIKKQRALKRLGSLSKKAQTAETACHTTLLEGKCSSQIRSLMELRAGDIAAAMRSRDDGSWYQSETTWAVLKSQSAAVLIIPDDAQAEPNTPYRRILAPLDGSARAEAVLPMAIKIAQAQSAELMLCYVPADPRMTEIGAKGHETAQLHAKVRDLNTKAGETYLGRTKRRLEHNGLKVSIRVTGSGDVRRSLIALMSRENADLVVMATHGQSGHRDVLAGDVARFVLEKAHIPVLLVRSQNCHNGHHTFGKLASKGVRKPTGTD